MSVPGPGGAATITKTCGLTGKRITTAIHALHKAGWLTRKLISNGRRSWYLIVFTKDILYGGRKATSIGALGKVEKRPPYNQSYGGRKTTPSYVSKKGGGSRCAPPPPTPTPIPTIRPEDLDDDSIPF